MVGLDNFSKAGENFSWGVVKHIIIVINSKYSIIFIFILFLFSCKVDIEQYENRIIIPEEKEIIKQQEIKTELVYIYTINPIKTLIKEVIRDSFNGEGDLLSNVSNRKEDIKKKIP